MKLDKLDALLAKTSTSVHNVSLFADMLSLPSDGRYPALDTTSELRREKTLEALGSQVEALSRSSPVFCKMLDEKICRAVVVTFAVALQQKLLKQALNLFEIARSCLEVSSRQTSGRSGSCVRV